MHLTCKNMQSSAPAAFLYLCLRRHKSASTSSVFAFKRSSFRPTIFLYISFQAIIHRFYRNQMLENGTKTATSSLDATAVSRCSRATAIFQLYSSIWSGTKSSATKGERGSRNEQTGSKRYNTDKSRHYPQLHVARVYSRR